MSRETKIDQPIQIPEELQKMFKQYLKDNIYIDISSEPCYDYGYSGTCITVTLRVDGEEISSTRTSISKD